MPPPKEPERRLNIRRRVDERLLAFFNALKQQLSHGVQDLWTKVESKVGPKPPDKR